MVFNKASLTTGITLAAEILSQEIIAITSQGGPGGYPSQIPASIAVGTAVVTDTGASIGISTEPRGEDNVEITLAFEKGSGLFGDSRQKYKIEPKEANLLAFMFPESLNIGVREGVKPVTDKSGKAILRWVMHPGIKPRPFLQRAINNVSARMLEVMTQNFEIQIFDGPKVEIIK